MKKRIIPIFLALTLVLSNLLCCIGANATNDDYKNCHLLKETKFGSTDNIIIEENVDLVYKKDLLKCLNEYISKRESDFINTQDTDNRKNAIRLFEKQSEIEIYDADVTGVLQSCTSYDDKISINLYEYTFFDYDDTVDTKIAFDVSGFGTNHELLLQMTNGNIKIIEDNYIDNLIETPDIHIDEDIDTDIVAENNNNNNNNNRSAPRGYSIYNSYNVTAAVEYSDEYALSYNTSYANFNGVGGDCANFVSQCIYAGGMPQIKCEPYGTNGWYYKSSSNRSATWTGAKYLRQWMGNNRGKLVNDPSDADIFVGSPLFVDWTNDGVWDHAYFCIGMNSSGTPIINSHNLDRYHIKWNYGEETARYSTVQLTTSNSQVIKPGYDVNDPNNYPMPVRTLRNYTSGEDVKWLQATFSKLGYSISVDGMYGNATESVVKSFQNTNGMSADGIAGANTIIRMQACHTAAQNVKLFGTDFYAHIATNSYSKYLESEGNNVRISKLNDTYNPKQIWHFKKNSNDSSYTIYNEYNGHLGYVLSTDGTSKTNGTNVKMSIDNGQKNQRWYISTIGGNMVLMNVNSGETALVLDVMSGKISSGANIQQWEYNSLRAQSLKINSLNFEGISYKKPAAPAKSVISVKSIGKPNEKTTLQWTISELVGKYDSRTYNLKVWNGTNTTKTPFIDIEDLITLQYDVCLPAGTYTASITSTNTKYYNYNTYSDKITFSIGNNYVIYYDANGGTGAPSSQTKSTGKNIVLSTKEPTRDGYIFLGWSTNKNATKPEYKKGDTFTLDTSVTLYAVWEKIQSDTSTDVPIRYYTVSYNLNGGIGLIPTQQCKEGDILTLASTIPFKQGYTFVGWSANNYNTEELFNPSEQIVVEKDLILYAVWLKDTVIVDSEVDSSTDSEIKDSNTDSSIENLPKECKISYNLNGVGGFFPTQTCLQGCTMTIWGMIPFNPGYIFLGWSEDQTATRSTYVPNGKIIVNDDIVLYAVWKDEFMIDDSDFLEETDSEPSIDSSDYDMTDSDTLLIESDLDIVESDLDITDNESDIESDSDMIIDDYFTDTDEIILGDVNLDGKVTMEDVVMAQKKVALIIELNEIQTTNADVDYDGIITMLDITLIQKYIAKLISSLL
ncbi:MAG: InlB B-repeat-containing protein [Clostridia bacterium]|nr:InlB B-repeat-containing protein [Clostridia bacterium]